MTNRSSTSLHEAAESGDISTLTSLLQKIDVNSREQTWLERTCLHAAASRKGNIEAIKIISNTKGVNINATDKTHWAPLHYACHCGDIQAVEFLLSRGADVNLECDNCSLALHKYVKTQGHPIANYLQILEKLAPPSSINHVTNRGETPLHSLCLSLHSHDQTLRFLIKQGADVNKMDKKGYVPLHYAILTGRKELVKTLLEFGADVTISSKQGTCKELAQSCFHTEIASLLSDGYIRVLKSIQRIESEINAALTPLEILSGLEQTFDSWEKIEQIPDDTRKSSVHSFLNRDESKKKARMKQFQTKMDKIVENLVRWNDEGYPLSSLFYFRMANLQQSTNPLYLKHFERTLAIYEFNSEVNNPKKARYVANSIDFLQTHSMDSNDSVIGIEASTSLIEKDLPKDILKKVLGVEPEEKYNFGNESKNEFKQLNTSSGGNSSHSSSTSSTDPISSKKGIRKLVQNQLSTKKTRRRTHSQVEESNWSEVGALSSSSNSPVTGGRDQIKEPFKDFSLSVTQVSMSLNSVKQSEKTTNNTVNTKTLNPPVVQGRRFSNQEEENTSVLEPPKIGEIVLYHDKEKNKVRFGRAMRMSKASMVGIQTQPLLSYVNIPSSGSSEGSLNIGGVGPSTPPLSINYQSSSELSSSDSKSSTSYGSPSISSLPPSPVSNLSGQGGVVGGGSISNSNGGAGGIVVGGGMSPILQSSKSLGGSEGNILCSYSSVSGVISPLSSTQLKYFPISEVFTLKEETKQILLSHKNIDSLVYDPSETIFSRLKQFVRDRLDTYLTDTLGIDLELLDKASSNEASIEDMSQIEEIKSKLMDLLVSQNKENVEDMAKEKLVRKTVSNNFFIQLEEEVNHLVADFLEKEFIWKDQLILIGKTRFFDQVRSCSSNLHTFARALTRTYLAICESSTDQLSLDKQKLVTGHLKDQLTTWWLRLIRVEVERFLEEKGYDLNAVPFDYIGEPPQDINVVKRNQQILKSVLTELNSKKKGTDVDNLLSKLKGEIYPKIKGFIRNSKFVISEHFNIDVDEFDLSILMNRFQEEKRTMEKSVAEYIGNLLSDIDYLEKMQAEDELLEKEKEAGENPTKKKGFTLDVVPVSGIIVGWFYRLENECNTVMDVWGHRLASLQ